MDEEGKALLQRSNSISLNVDYIIEQLLSVRGERERRERAGGWVHFGTSVVLSPSKKVVFVHHQATTFSLSVYMDVFESRVQSRPGARKPGIGSRDHLVISS